MDDMVAKLAYTPSKSAVSLPESAQLTPNTDILVTQLDRVFGAANDDTFEDGIESVFSANLNRIIQDHGAAAVDALEMVIRMCHVNVVITEEALRQVGRMDDAQTHDRRSLS